MWAETGNIKNGANIKPHDILAKKILQDLYIPSEIKTSPSEFWDSVHLANPAIYKQWNKVILDKISRTHLTTDLILTNHCKQMNSGEVRRSLFYHLSGTSFDVNLTHSVAVYNQLYKANCIVFDKHTYYSDHKKNG